MENSWENFNLHMEMDCENDFLDTCRGSDEDEFLRDILQQPPASFALETESDHSSFHVSALNDVVLSPNNNNLVKSNSTNSLVSQTGSKRPRRLSSPRTYILSFDNSTMVPATPKPCLVNDPSLNDTGKRRSSNTSSALPAKRASESVGPEPKTRPNQGAKKARTVSQTVDHILAERRRRQELTERFIALSATIPGLNKTDKASVLRAAIDYVKELQERVQELEKQDKKKSLESVILVKKPCNQSGNEDTTFTETNCRSTFPEMEARVLGKEVLIEIHCVRENGIELKILDHLENLNLNVTGSSVLPFGNSALCITITAQMSDTYQMTVDDLVKELRVAISKFHVYRNSDPY